MMKQRQINKNYKRFDKRDKESGGSSDEETELFVRNKSPRREVPTLEKNVEENDTLQSLAIRYHCTIEELKRLNNIHKENEIYARTKIKVPQRPFSEALAPVHGSGTSSPAEPATSRLIDIDSLESKLDETRTTSGMSDVNHIIFNSNIVIKEPERANGSFLGSEEDVTLLPHNSQPPQPDPIISKMSCNGSDWDISYPALIVCIVLLIFAIPLIYVFYIAEHPEIYLNHTNGSNGS